MIKTTPFHPRTSAANQTGLWMHWAGYLSAPRYGASSKFEYYAVRNAAGVFDTSPLYKYQITGSDAESYLAGLLARDIRKCRPGRAQYTAWLDDDGFVVEDGVVLRLSGDEFLLTTAHPNQGYLDDMRYGKSVTIEDVSADMGALALQGPYAQAILQELAPEITDVPYFGVTPAKIGEAPVTISRTGFTGDLGYEIWVGTDEAVDVWDRVMDVAGPMGVIPFGEDALQIARIEAGLLLIDVDFQSSRFAWNDDQRHTLREVGFGWMVDLERDDRAFVGRSATERGEPRWVTTGVIVDWQSWDEVYKGRGLVPEKDHTPSLGGKMLYDSNVENIGHVTSFVYSPLLQRHIGIGRIRPDHARPGAKVSLEVTIDHRYDLVDATVTRLPFYNPKRKTA